VVFLTATNFGRFGKIQRQFGCFGKIQGDVILEKSKINDQIGREGKDLNTRASADDNSATGI
jgi:hypothetical protein